MSKHVYQTYVNTVMKLAKASNAEEAELILRPVHYPVLSKVDTSVAGWQQGLINNIQDEDSDLYKIEEKYYQTNALSIAICLHNKEILEYFLQYTTCNQVNAWGYRQEWGAVHLATDPAAHISALRYDIDAISKVRGTLDILKQHNADFDYIGEYGGYNNPALALGRPKGAPVISSWKEQDIIRKALIKHGANPFLIGSSYNMVNNLPALKQLIQSKHYDENQLMLQYISAVITHKNTWIKKNDLKESISRSLGESDIFTSHAEPDLVQQYTKQEILRVIGDVSEDVTELIYDYVAA